MLTRKLPDVLSSLQEYSRFIYTLAEHYSAIQNSTLIVIPLGATMGSARGILYFEHSITLRVVEEIDFRAARIDYYSYTIEQTGERLYWYDPQPHPDDPTLAANHPHHKHVPPDIKHNRIPAPGLSFEQPNLPFLIREIEGLLEEE